VSQNIRALEQKIVFRKAKILFAVADAAFSIPSALSGSQL
jgi:hypothetical protein